MKDLSRRQVRTPVKRGAGPEGTPKTPRSFEGMNVDAMAVGGSVASAESTLRPFLLIGELKSRGESEAVTALSPISLNAIRGNPDHRAGWEAAAASKKPSEMSPTLVVPKIKGKDYDNAFRRKGHGRVLEDENWNANEDHGEVKPGSCPSSPDSRTPSLLSEEPMFLWSNAAFNQGLAPNKDTASSSSGSSSMRSSHLKETIIEGADCEAESETTTTHEDPLPGIDAGGRCRCNYNAKYEWRRESPIVHATANIKNGKGADQKTKSHGQFNIELEKSNSARTLLFENDKFSSRRVSKQAVPYGLQRRPEQKERTDLQSSVMQNEESRPDQIDGLEEIEKEIRRLTKRLTELQLQKRAWEKEIRRRGEENDKKTESAYAPGSKRTADRDRWVVHQRLSKRSDQVSTAAKRGKDPVLRQIQSPRTQLRQIQGCPLASGRRRGERPSPGKLSDLRRSVSVSAASQKKAEISRSYASDVDRSKVLKRLSMSGAMTMMSSPSNVQGQQQQQRQRYLPNSKLGSCTPASRVVSSRYGRATVTSDEAYHHRLSSSHNCKIRADDQQLSSAPSSPAAPLKLKFTTLRSGYPSRSGIAVTPTKEPQQLKSHSSVSRTLAICPSSNSHASFSSSSPFRTQNLVDHSDPNQFLTVPRDGPKSTAALYKCLESLLEDSKHFFQPNVSRQQAPNLES